MRQKSRGVPFQIIILGVFLSVLVSACLKPSFSKKKNEKKVDEIYNTMFLNGAKDLPLNGTLTLSYTGGHAPHSLNIFSGPGSLSDKTYTAPSSLSDNSTSVSIRLSDSKGYRVETSLTVYQPGKLDTSFGSDGTGLVSYNPVTSREDIILNLALQSDGKIVGVGYYDRDGSNDMDIIVVRYNSNGTLDTTFDSDGVFTYAPTTSDDVANGVAIQSDGKIVVVGYRYVGAANNDVLVFRLNTDGSYDTSFDSDGILSFEIAGGGTDDNGLGVAIQSDGKIVIAGETVSAGDRKMALARLNSDGSLDTTFDSDGKVVLGNNGRARKVQVLSNGNIWIVGGTTSYVLARLTSAGALDTSFDSDGFVSTEVGSGGDEIPRGFVVQSDGKIVLAGGAFDGTTNCSGSIACEDWALVRYNSDGSLDTSCDTDGRWTRNMSSTTTQHENAYQLLLQSDGKLVIVGAALMGATGRDMTVVRLNTDCSLDSTFDSDGIGTYNFSGSADDSGFAGLILSDGKILISGYSQSSGWEAMFGFAKIWGQ